MLYAQELNLFSHSDRIKIMAMHATGLILGLRPANERQRYFVTTSLIDWVQT